MLSVIMLNVVAPTLMTQILWFSTWVSSSPFTLRHDIEHNDIQQTDTQHQHNETQNVIRLYCSVAKLPTLELKTQAKPLVGSV